MNVKSYKLRIAFELLRSTLPVVIFVAVYAFSYFAYCHHYHIQGMEVHPSELLYKSLRLFVVEGEIDEPRVSGFLNVMRFVAPLTTVMGAIAAFTVLLGRRFKDLRLTTLADHVVICGLGRKGNSLARQFRAQGKKVVVIDIDESNEYFSIQMLSNIWTIAGNAADPEILAKANLSTADCLVIATGSDSTNINILIHAANQVKARKHHDPLHVVLHMYDSAICPLMRNKQVLMSIRQRVNLVTVNMYELAARQLFLNDMLDNMPTDIQSKQRMHVAIAGFGNMGQAIALQTAKTGHFASAAPWEMGGDRNNQTPKPLLKPLITIIDENAEKAGKEFTNRFSQFVDLCEINTIEGDIHDPAVYNHFVDLLKNETYLSSIFICYEDDYYNIKNGLSIIDRLKQQYERKKFLESIDIFVELSESEGLYHLLEEENAETALARQLKGFMAVPDLFYTDEGNNAGYEIMGRVFAASYEEQFDLPDGIKKPGWDNLSFRLQDSNMQAAHHIGVKLRTLGYQAVPSVDGIFLSDKKGGPFFPDPGIQLPITDEEREILAVMEHNRWLAEIKLEGYTYSSSKDPNSRKHPCCVPWERLDEKNKVKDLAQIDIIPVALLNAGFIPMKMVLANLYQNLDSRHKLLFEDLAIGLLNGGAALVEKAKQCKINDFLGKTQSKEILLISGVSDESQFDQKAKEKLTSVLSNFAGVVISGRISAGIQQHICSITDNLRKQNRKMYVLLGYLPQKLSSDNLDSRYDRLIKTQGVEFSELESIQCWLDIVLAGFEPSQVKYVCFKSEDDGFDFQLSKELGANVEILN
ncbi:MAG: potassium transporter peripheral membrane component [Planctomycetes bacterium ADurb.Bin412]|nr:MAG: potassium transporter peripheral membrane component [Planctomycetes bacterium ADurb.Bin412]